MAPVVPLRVLWERNRGGSYLVGLMIGTALLAFFLFLTFYLQQILGYSALRSGVAFLPFTVGIGIGVGLSAQLATRLRPPRTWPSSRHSCRRSARGQRSGSGRTTFAGWRSAHS